MVSGFTKSEEGIKEYEKLGLPYPEEIFDGLYEKWLKDTSAEDLSKYTPHKEKEISMLHRIRTGDGKQYLVYSFNHYRLDEALNVKHFWRPNIGMYPIPRPIYKTTIAAFGKQQREVSDIQTVDKGYSIPFTAANLDKIKDSQALEYEGRISYTLQTSNGLRVSIATYEDFRDGDYDELLHFGKIPTEIQRQRWIEEKGIEQDKKWQEEILRRRTEGDVPQRSPTLEETKRMIQEAVSSTTNTTRKRTTTKKDSSTST